MLHRCDVRDGEGWRGGDRTDEARERHENHGNRGSSWNRFTLLHGPLEGAAGSGNSAVDVLGIAFGDGREHLTGGRIERLELLPRGSIDPFGVDQHFRVGTIRIGMTR